MAVVSEILQQLQGLVGVVIITLGAWALSEDRRGRPSFRWILGALLMQVLVALLVVRVPFVWSVIGLANHAVAAIEKATLVGSSYMFGYTGGAPAPFVLKEGALSPVIIAFQILPLIIVYSALAALLWRWGVLSRIVAGLSWALRRTLGVSGVVGLSSGASIFLGVVEAPLVVRAYFERMSRSELFAVMTLAMATISGAILVLYAQTLARTVPDAVGHMISASLISLPAAILVARLMVPGNAATEASVEETGLHYDSSIDAIVRGTMDGVQLFLAVIGMIIVIFALVTLVDQVLALAPAVQGEPLTLRRVFGWLFAPFMWTLGVPWDQAPQAG
ncbi:MAG: nucleoside:proton symporter, partial [Phenylobacterium sp.]|nr:nucleoside:proton symporter [Phenylobacterium sp.]